MLSDLTSDPPSFISSGRMSTPPRLQLVTLRPGSESVAMVMEELLKPRSEYESYLAGCGLYLRCTLKGRLHDLAHDIGDSEVFVVLGR